jgi:acetylornithine deacetylase
MCWYKKKAVLLHSKKKLLSENNVKVDDEYTVEVLKKLVQINSVNPQLSRGPGEGEVANEIARLLESAGLEVKMQKVESSRYNVIGILEGESHNGRSLMLNGHMDTVGVSDMQIAPFDPVIRNGLLYGRGSCDMKGGLSGAISAIVSLAKSEARLRGDLYLSAVVDEEYKSTGTEAVINRYKTDAAVVAEPTKMSVGIAHMGYVWMEVETKGRTAHGSVPERGHDAIADMAYLIEEIERSTAKYQKKTKKSHPLLGNPKIHTSTITGGQGWSVVPDYCKLQIERRILPGEKTEDCRKEIQKALIKVRSRYPKVRAKVRVDFERPPMETPKSAYIVQAVAKAHQLVTMRRPQFVGLTYWSDSSIFSTKGKIPTCLYGPGDINLAHSPLEYVPIKEVKISAHVYALAAVKYFCGNDEKNGFVTQ